MKKWLIAALGMMVGAAVTVGALAVTMPAVSGPSGSGTVLWNQSARRTWSHWTRGAKYTQADYQLALSLKTAAYEKTSVAEFDKQVADWADEEVFHQREAALQRLLQSYGEEKENAQFIHVTLAAALDNCAVKHYGGQCTALTLTYGDEAERVREADVFGDRYPVFEASVGYTAVYRITDETALTVGERDRLLLAYRAAVQAFLDGRTEKQLLDEKAMEKAAAAELARLDRALSTEQLTFSGTELAYYYAYDATAEN